MITESNARRLTADELDRIEGTLPRYCPECGHEVTAMAGRAGAFCPQYEPDGQLAINKLKLSCNWSGAMSEARLSIVHERLIGEIRALWADRDGT